MLHTTVGSILIGGGGALIASPFIRGTNAWQEFPFIMAGIFLVLAGGFFLGLYSEAKNKKN